MIGASLVSSREDFSIKGHSSRSYNIDDDDDDDDTF